MASPWRGIRPWKRHSLVLLVAGGAYFWTGISYITAEPTEARTVALQFAFRWMDLPSWGVIFCMAGVLSVISSRWPPISETWGYSVLTGLSTGWSAFYAAGILFGDSPKTNWSGVIIWGLMGFVWWAISGLKNPDGTGATHGRG